MKAKGGTFLRRESWMISATIPQTPDSNICYTAVYLETQFDLTQLLRANSGKTFKTRLFLSRQNPYTHLIHYQVFTSLNVRYCIN